jgi:predicted CXXCH cytochrome family protein
MRKFIYLTVCLLAVLAIGLLVNPGANAAISSSAHDFRGDSWYGTEDQICLPCHTPHESITTVTDAPLWNHAVTTATYTMYDDTNLDGSVGSITAVTKLCLTCHDGTVALENFGGVTTGTNYVSGTAAIGTDLSNHHPVAVTYVDTAGTGMKAKSTDISALSITGVSTIADLLVGTGATATVECSSCHDVHNGETVDKLLLVDNAASALCLACHDK